MFFRRSKRASEAVTPSRRRPSRDVSLTGLVYLALTTFMALAAINTQANLLFGVFGLMLGILFVSYWISDLVLRKLDLTRRLPDHAVVGEPTSVAYEFTNRKRFWPSLSVTIAELDGADGFVRQPQGYLLHAAAGMTASVPVELIPKRRGLLEFGRHQVSTSFPFGFIKRAIDRDRPISLLVYPPIGQVDSRLLQMARSTETVGPTLRPRRGGHDEFYGLREYRTGENPRMIYWRRSARTDTLVSREMTHVSPPRFMVMVDTFISDRTPAQHADVEMSIAMAASLVSYAIEADIPVGLVAWSDGFRIVEPQRGKRHRRDLLNLLATLPLNTRHGSADLFAAGYDGMDAAASPVLFTSSDDSPAHTLVIRPHTAAAKRWFRFAPSIDFARVMPAAQQPPAFIETV